MTDGARHPLAAVAATLALLAFGCADNDARHPPAGSGSGDNWRCSQSIALDGDRVWVASTDDRALVAVDADTLQLTTRFELDEAPLELVVASQGVWFTSATSGTVTHIDPTSGAATAFAALPCRRTRALCLDDEAGLAIASCPDERAVVAFSLTAPTVVGVYSTPDEPSGLSIHGGVLAIAQKTVGAVTTSIEALVSSGGPTVRPLPIERTIAPADAERGAVSQSFAVSADRRADGGFIAAAQRVDNDDRSRPPERGSYGDVFDGDPRIEPVLIGSPCGPRFARFDGGERVFAGPSAVATHEDLVWVVNQYTRNVVVLECQPSAVDELPPLRAIANVGHGARGIALSQDGTVAWVDNEFDRSVSRIALTDVGADVLTQTRPFSSSPFSAAAERGRRTFHDARDTHLTPSGVVACATCHPDGGDDGLTWFIHTPRVAAKVRRTQPAWGARPALLPLHWAGDIETSERLFTETVIELLGGDGLLLDARAVAAYMAELPPPLPAPSPAIDVFVGGAEAVARGHEIFRGAGCDTCHAGPLFSDGQRHDVLARTGDPMLDLEVVKTPSLLGVGARSPLLHDGRAATLRDVLTTHNASDDHGQTTSLTATELDDLVRFLWSL